ncbi:MAG: hypothetical protein LAT75_12585 [Candidatus Cyclonatronum sp.]|uniref:hypothetical protein n=1 Tax=Cyclonatronum sp. TaxID=3024185 RepID=UPI0025C13E48|nr:hypothetical protein [Cyclonatronum sp.]MCC5935268.1 hypothetical protein [Balneolales bacterium]MCH8487697.1 hypothetical protein [Cyclonatronum sp.]
MSSVSLKYITPSLLLLLTAFVFAACSATNAARVDVSEVNNATFENDSYDVFQATLSALNQNGFVVRRSNSSDGMIEADFINPGSTGSEERFFGYSSSLSRHVRAELSLIPTLDGGTRVSLNLFEVFPPAPAQYGSINTANTQRRMRDVRFYEGLLRHIEERLEERNTSS